MRLSLRPISAEHAEAFALAAARSLQLHAGLVSPPVDPAKAADLIARRQGPNDLGYVLVEPGTGAMVGYVEVTGIVRGCFQSAYLGYYVFEGHQGRGHMRGALSEVLQLAWETLGLHRLEANIQPGNRASIGLVSRLGFSKEGYSPKYLKISGEWRDHERWAILAPDGVEQRSST
jgi:[ribosomal protein S5]-alanine N-acetyltransferase